MRTLLRQLESWLRLSRFERTSDLMRARIIYIICGAFVFTQVINLFAMTRLYGGWTFDHNLSLGAITFVVMLTAALRFTDNFHIQALGIFTFTWAAIIASATSEGTGINSALLPFIPIGIVMAGSISGWIMSYVAGALSLLLIVYLHQYSSQVPPGHIFDPNVFAERNTARAVQIAMATVMTSIMTGLISLNMYKALRRLEKIVHQTREDERSKTEFLANMGREIHAPLQGIQDVSDRLLHTHLNADQHQYAKIIKDCSASLSAIAEDVLDYTKIDAACLTLQPSRFNIRELARSLVFLHYPSTARKGLKLHLQIDRKTPEYIFGDESRIRQVINNLLSNAIKFTRDGEITLLIGGKVQKGSRFLLHVCVQDTGIGIRKENYQRIFERFFKASSMPEGANPGTGLGLSISKDIVELMGGKLKVQSANGDGSKFFFTIPVDITEAHQDTAAPDPKPSQFSQVA